MDFPCTQQLPDDLDGSNFSDDEKKQVGIIVVEENSKIGIESAEYPIFEGENIIGRHENCDVAIPSGAALSKKHACIEAEGDSAYIYDFGSSNKTRLGKLRLKPEIRYCIQDGNTITFANVKCIYKMVGVKQNESEVGASPDKAKDKRSDFTVSTPTAVPHLLALDTPETQTNDRLQTHQLDTSECSKIVPDSQPCNESTFANKSQNNGIDFCLDETRESEIVSDSDSTDIDDDDIIIKQTKEINNNKDNNHYDSETDIEDTAPCSGDNIREMEEDFNEADVPVDDKKANSPAASCNDSFAEMATLRYAPLDGARDESRNGDTDTLAEIDTLDFACNSPASHLTDKDRNVLSTICENKNLGELSDSDSDTCDELACMETQNFVSGYNKMLAESVLDNNTNADEDQIKSESDTDSDITNIESDVGNTGENANELLKLTDTRRRKSSPSPLQDRCSSPLDSSTEIDDTLPVDGDIELEGVKSCVKLVNSISGRQNKKFDYKSINNNEENVCKISVPLKRSSEVVSCKTENGETCSVSKFINESKPSSNHLIENGSVQKISDTTPKPADVGAVAREGEYTDMTVVDKSVVDLDETRTDVNPFEEETQEIGDNNFTVHETDGDMMSTQAYTGVNVTPSRKEFVSSDNTDLLDTLPYNGDLQDLASEMTSTPVQVNTDAIDTLCYQNAVTPDDGSSVDGHDMDRCDPVKMIETKQDLDEGDFAATQIYAGSSTDVEGHENIGSKIPAIEKKYINSLSQYNQAIGDTCVLKDGEELVDDSLQNDNEVADDKNNDGYFCAATQPFCDTPIEKPLEDETPVKLNIVDLTSIKSTVPQNKPLPKTNSKSEISTAARAQRKGRGKNKKHKDDGFVYNKPPRSKKGVKAKQPGVSCSPALSSTSGMSRTTEVPSDLGAQTNIKSDCDVLTEILVEARDMFVVNASTSGQTKPAKRGRKQKQTKDNSAKITAKSIPKEINVKSLVDKPKKRGRPIKAQVVETSDKHNVSSEKDKETFSKTKTAAEKSPRRNKSRRKNSESGGSNVSVKDDISPCDDNSQKLDEATCSNALKSTPRATIEKPIKKEIAESQSKILTSESDKVSVKTEVAKTIRRGRKRHSDANKQTEITMPPPKVEYDPQIRADVCTKTTGRRKRNFSVESNNKLKNETPAKKMKEEPLRAASLSLRPRKIKPFVMFTGIIDKIGETIVKELGGRLTDNVHECTHLVTDKIRRTVKFLCAVVRGIFILNGDWLRQSKQHCRFLEESAFELSDDALNQSSITSSSPSSPSIELQYGFKLCESLIIARTRGRPLFGGQRIHVTNSVLPPPDQMYQIIECGGGDCVRRMPRGDKLQGLIVVSAESDKKPCSTAIKAGIPVVNKEFILTGILRQKLEVDTFRLFHDVDYCSHNISLESKSSTSRDKPSVSLSNRTSGENERNVRQTRKRKS